MQTVTTLEQTRRRINTAIGLCAVTLAVAAFVWMTSTAPRAELTVTEFSPPSVEVLCATPVRFNAPIVGYGTVRPKRQVKIVPEVGGRLVAVHQDFAVGNVIAKGDLLFEIDARVYKARVAQAEAETTRLNAQLEQLDQQQAGLTQRLDVARRQAELANKNLERERELFEKGSTRRVELETVEREQLRQLDTVLEFESRLAAIPYQMQETEATLQTKQAQLEEAELAVEKCKIFCPFDARVDSVTAQHSQVVVASLQIATLTDMEAFEVSVVIDPRELRWTDRKSFASAIGPDVDNAPEVRVAWTLRGRQLTWTGKVTRLEKMDEETRSAHLVVEIRDIMLSTDPETGMRRAPLSVGMFCRAEIPTEPLENALLVPRYAIHENAYVYVFEPKAGGSDQGTLRLKRIPMLRTAGEDVLVTYAGRDNKGEGETCELMPEDLVVLSPLPKAVDGMALTLRTGETEVAFIASDPPAPFSLFDPFDTASRSPGASPRLLGAIGGAP